ncbi:DUF4114 domain-containing protein [Nodosilinea sp. LEGE 07298]|uniref:DUF4114 domain-containing protein n=1 Tax=Nodosilinea sp. LEGE 07298 TaxID=2777970 RepID=UPI001880A114|nr:DUF4114 domain-containing protein [Nodosilinea sp. LEGE 07298]MBE9112369.1 DUF4114 domain-containing protein [Nodosilinea sp. LEGE 07298]
MASLILSNLSSGNPGDGRVNVAAFNNGILLLTPTTPVGDSAGAAFSDKIELKNDTSFSTKFEFQTSATGAPEGFTFIVHNDPAGRNALGGTAPGLGYRPFTLRGSNSSIINALVVELDTFSNTADQLFDNIADVGDNTIEIALIDGQGDRILGSSPEGFQTAFGAFDFNNGSVHTAWIDYDGTSQTLEVFLATGTNPPKPVTSAFSLNLPAQGTSLEAILGGTSGYVGFTAATGGPAQSHQILSFDFLATPTVDPGPVDPGPVDPGPVNPGPIDPGPQLPLGNLGVTGNNLLKLDGVSDSQGATFSVVKPSRAGAVEIGFFELDDAQGNIKGIAPDNANYIATALPTAKIVFSTLGDLDIQGLDVSRQLALDPSRFYAFFLIQDGTLDSVLDGGPGKVTVASPLFNPGPNQPLRFGTSQAGNGLDFNWDLNNDQQFDDFIFRVELGNQGPTLGANLQGGSESEVLDLRGLTGQVQLELEVKREAANTNTLGFYRIENAQGTVLDEFGNALNPGDAGYIQAAVRQWAGQPLISPQNGSTQRLTVSVAGDQILAPFLISNGTIEQILDGNPANDPAVFLPFLGANPGGVDQVKLLGDNTFGFEDLVGGGDFDYDDLVVKINVQPV